MGIALFHGFSVQATSIDPNHDFDRFSPEVKAICEGVQNVLIPYQEPFNEAEKKRSVIVMPMIFIMDFMIIQIDLALI